jgi:hypothetical protein
MEDRSKNGKLLHIDTTSPNSQTTPNNEFLASGSRQLNTATQNGNDQYRQIRNAPIMAQPDEPPHEQYLLSPSPDEDNEPTSEAPQLPVPEQECSSSSKIDKGKGAVRDSARRDLLGMDGSSDDQHQDYTTISQVVRGNGRARDSATPEFFGAGASLDDQPQGYTKIPEVDKDNGRVVVSAMPDYTHVKTYSYSKNPQYGSEYGSSVAETESDIEPTIPRVALRRCRSRGMSLEFELSPPISKEKPARKTDLDYENVPCEHPCQHNPGTCINLQNQGPEFQQHEVRAFVSSSSHFLNSRVGYSE